MEIQSGYKTITPIQFANVLWALEQGDIDRQGLRVYFACFALVAVREAANRSRAGQGQKPKLLARYRLNELQRLTWMPLRAVNRALARLRSAGLVAYGEAAIVLTEAPLSSSHELLAMLSCGRSPRRPIPVPRSILRFLAGNVKTALTKTIVAYLLRGLSLARHGGDVSHKGTVKVSWIAEVFNMSERAVRYARACLIQMGWIEPDTHSYQRKLNRDGAYFVINLDWSLPKMAIPSPASSSAVPALVKREKPVTEIAPPPVQNCTDFAPPVEDKKTSNEVDQNQKARPTEPGVSGFYKQGRGSPKSPTPTLHRIQREDLHHFDALEILYFEAIARGWIDASEATALNFIAAAVRARERGRDPARLFVALVRRGLWHHITQAQEDHARRALIRFREQNPDRFRWVEPERSRAAALDRKLAA